MFGHYILEPHYTAVHMEGGPAPQPPPPPPSWRRAQAAIDDLFVWLEGAAAPPGYTYATLVRYLSDFAAAPTDSARVSGDFAALMACRSDPASGGSLATSFNQVVGLLAKAAEGKPVYLADQHAYVREALAGEFPELQIFNILMADAFAKSETPGFWIETVRFASLRSLSRMRREIRRTGLRCAEQDPTKLIAILLGLSQPAQ